MEVGGSVFTPWLHNTTLTEAVYVGNNGHEYSFYSVATDYVGHKQATPTDAQATTRVPDAIGTKTVLSSSSLIPTYGQSLSFTATVSATTTGEAPPTGSVQFQIDGVDFGAPVPLLNGVATSALVTNLSAGLHVITANYTGGGIYARSISDELRQTVAKARLTVVADNKSRSFGSPNPQLTFSLTALSTEKLLVIQESQELRR